MPADRLAETDSRVEVVPVSTATTLNDEKNPVELMSLGPGPHSSAGLGVYVPAAGYFYVSDVHVPRSDDDTPRVERATTECWFARWAVEHLPPETRVLNSHSSPQTPVSRLRNYLDSAACQALSS